MSLGEVVPSRYLRMAGHVEMSLRPSPPAASATLPSGGCRFGTCARKSRDARKLHNAASVPCQVSGVVPRIWHVQCFLSRRWTLAVYREATRQEGRHDMGVTTARGSEVRGSGAGKAATVRGLASPKDAWQSTNTRPRLGGIPYSTREQGKHHAAIDHALRGMRPSPEPGKAG